MAHVLGARTATVVAAIAVMTTTNTTLLALTAASRVMYGMAKAGAMPSALALVHPTRRTPIRAITAAAVVAAAFAVYVVFIAVNGTVIILRRMRPELPRPFAVAWAIRGVPVLPVLGLGSVALMMTHLEALAIGVGMAACGAGLAAGWRVRAWR